MQICQSLAKNMEQSEVKDWLQSTKVTTVQYKYLDMETVSR